MPINDYKEIVLAHGSGGKLSQRLHAIDCAPAVSKRTSRAAARRRRLCSTVTRRLQHRLLCGQPDLFSRRRYRKLAVHGTVNDLAMCGARPLYLSVGFILEEGLPMDDFWRIVQSMREAAAAAGVMLVTGDTKVVDRGKPIRFSLTPQALALSPEGVNIDPSRAQSATRSSSAGKLRCTASPSCPCVKVSNSKLISRATPRH